MPSPRTHVRFAVGTRGAERSTIWKLWTQGNEIYLASRMFGSDMKASFHSSGECQWSCTDSWVRRQESARNTDRHVKRWSVQHPTGNQALLLFRVEIPVSEVRPQPSPSDNKKVFWVSGAPRDATIRFLLYLTRAVPEPPALPDNEGLRHLVSLRTREGRWVVVFLEAISLSATELESARQAVRQQMAEAGFSPRPEHRASLLISPNDPQGAHGLLELCLTEA